MKNIGFIGNFNAPFSTENDRRWSFMKLGHNVFAFQENETYKATLMDYLPGLDMLVYSHTHGWEIKGLKSVFKACKKMNIPTISVHLDKWAGLEREKDIGKEATWFTEFMFMADCSPRAIKLYKEHKLNYFYLKPGVVERDCYMAAPDPIRFPHEIVFLGSKGYHKEYPFRPNMIEFLQQTYGERFGHYGSDGIETLRGHGLNVLMATAKIVVGDSCFAGGEGYWSDRVTETMGRGGFLLHPTVHELPTGLMGVYKAGNLKDLKYRIDFWFQYKTDIDKMRKKGFEFVKLNETYTHRAKEILEIVFK